MDKEIKEVEDHYNYLLKKLENYSSKFNQKINMEEKEYE